MSGDQAGKIVPNNSEEEDDEDSDDESTVSDHVLDDDDDDEIAPTTPAQPAVTVTTEAATCKKRARNDDDEDDEEEEEEEEDDDDDDQLNEDDTGVKTTKSKKAEIGKESSSAKRQKTDHDDDNDDVVLIEKKQDVHDTVVEVAVDDESTKSSAKALESEETTAVEAKVVDDSCNGSRQKTPESKEKTKPRWTSHQIAEDYIDLASHMMLHPLKSYKNSINNNHNQTTPIYGFEFQQSPKQQQQLPLESISALGYLTSPFRRATVLERWSPYEIALFEASMAEYGKVFHQIQRHVKTKTTHQVVEFYYIWKKTSHYQKWKKSYVPDHLDVSDDETENENQQKIK